VQRPQERAKPRVLSVGAPAPGSNGNGAARDTTPASWLDALASTAVRLTPQNTEVRFSVRWLGGLVVRGRFTRVSGAIVVPADDLSAASVKVDIAADSVQTGIALRDRHLRGPLFLDVARFPAISFRGASVMRWSTHVAIPGSLTVRGTTRTHELVCRVIEPDPESTDRNAIVLEAEATLLRSEFRVGDGRGIRRIDPLLLVIGDEVRVSVRVTIPRSE